MIPCINNPYLVGNNRYKKNISFKAKPIPDKSFSELINLLFSSKSWDIYCHRSADHDTKKSAIVMAYLARKMGIKPYICIEPHEMKPLLFNPYKNSVLKRKDSAPSDIALILDHNGWDKIPLKFTDLVKKTKTKIVIDHHPLTEKSFKNAYSYIDTTAKACRAIIYRFFEAFGKEVDNFIAKNLALGLLSDYEKSKLITFKKSKLIKLPALESDKNWDEILEKIKLKLLPEDETKICKHLDVISNLTPKEKAFRTELFSKIKVTDNGKLAYVIINPNDVKWKAVGRDNYRTSTILGDLRLRLINGALEDEMFTRQQKDKFKKLKGAVVFYPAGEAYQLSIHSKDNGYAAKWLEFAKKAFKEYYSGHPKFEFFGGGHPNRGGGRIFSHDKTETENIIKSILEAAERVN